MSSLLAGVGGWQADNVVRVLRTALHSKRALYGHTLEDSRQVFELADTDGETLSLYTSCVLQSLRVQPFRPCTLCLAIFASPLLRPFRQCVCDDVVHFDAVLIFD